MKINIDEIIKFFDANMERGHATSIVGLLGEDLNAWAFKYFMEKTRGAQVEILPDHVVSGKKKGKWLDRWIYVKEGKKEILYQCEIKNWSCTALGGRKLELDADINETIETSRYHWKCQVRDFKQRNFPNGVTKVLTEMKRPKKYSDVTIEPLVIYWMPVSNTDALRPFFQTPISKFDNSNIKTKFKKISMFSVSLFLRELRKEKKNRVINVNLPNAEKRISVLKSILADY